MPYPYTLTPDGHTLEPEDVVKPPAETQEESTSTQSPFLDFGNPPLPQTGAPTLDPVTGPPAFDSGPSPHLTQEATSHAQPPSTDEEVDRRKQRKERARQRFENAKQSSRAIADIPDFADLGQFGAEPPPASAMAEWPDRAALTQGQEMHIAHLLSVETNTLAREVLFGLMREGMPSEAFVSDFVSQFAEWGWDDLKSALALQVLEDVRNSDWDEVFAYADEDYVETVAQDLGDDWIEGLVIINARTGDILLDRTGVVSVDGSQYVGLQDYEVEALKGLELIFVHNHPNGSDASAEDLDSAFRSGAELLIVITPQGQEFVYIRGRYGMVKVRDEQASYEVGPATLRETRDLVARSKAQARKYLDDPPEYVFLQDEPGFTERLAKAAAELNLDTEVPASELIERLLNKATADERAFGLAAMAYYGYGDSNAVGSAADLKKLLERTLPYWKTAEVTGVDPGLLAQLVLWETPHWLAFWEYADYGTMYHLGVKSFGIAQIKVDTATDMLKLYLGKFADLGSVLSDMEDDNQSWDEYEVGWALYSNEEFSIRAAGVYLAHIGDRIDSDMDDKYHVQITDAQTEDPRSITWHQRQMLTAIGYNQGMSQAIARLAIRYTEGVESVIRDTIGSGFVPDVLPPDGLQSELEAELNKRGVIVSDEETDGARIRPFELGLLTKVAYVQGLDQLLRDLDAEFKRAGAANVVAGVKNIIRVNDYDDNVLGMQAKAFELYGLSYEGGHNEA